MALTLTAVPSATPPQTAQLDAPLCNPANLVGKAIAGGATGSVTIDLILTNLGSKTCNLQGPPQIELISGGGQPLGVQSFLNCFQCYKEESTYTTPSAPTQTAMIPTQTAVAEGLLYRKVSLSPGQSASVFLIWDNWCKPFPRDGVSLRLSLTPQGAQLVVPTDAYVGGRCDVPDAASTVMVSHFQ